MAEVLLAVAAPPWAEGWELVEWSVGEHIGRAHGGSNDRLVSLCRSKWMRNANGVLAGPTRFPTKV